MALRQAYSEYGSNSISSIAVVEGDLIVVLYGANSTTTTATCADNAGGGTNTYTKVVHQAGNLSDTDTISYMYWAKAKASETLTITCTSLSDPGISVHIYSGMDGASPVDNYTSGYESSSGTSHTVGSLVTSNASDVLVGFAYNYNYATGFAGTGSWVARTNQSDHYHGSFDQTVGATGTYSLTFSTDSSSRNGYIIAAFKVAGVSAPSIPVFHRRGQFIRRPF